MFFVFFSGGGVCLARQRAWVFELSAAVLLFGAFAQIELMLCVGFFLHAQSCPSQTYPVTGSHRRGSKYRGMFLG